jgi:hypothetical protein
MLQGGQDQDSKGGPSGDGPATPHAAATPAAPDAGRRRSLRRAVVLLVPVLLAAAFTVGIAVGRQGDWPAGPAASPITVGRDTATTTAPTSAPPPSSTAPRACLDTARYGDQVIALLTANVRDRRVSERMERYAQASQACRAAVAP